MDIPEKPHKRIKLPPSDKKRLLIFDMDETLIHCLPSNSSVVSDTGSSDPVP